jgi:hypothetical protein
MLCSAINRQKNKSPHDACHASKCAASEHKSMRRYDGFQRYIITLPRASSSTKIEILAVAAAVRRDAVRHVDPTGRACRPQDQAGSRRLPCPLSRSYTCTAPTGSTANTYCPSTVKPMIVTIGLAFVSHGKRDRVTQAPACRSTSCRSAPAGARLPSRRTGIELQVGGIAAYVERIGLRVVDRAAQLGERLRYRVGGDAVEYE